MKKLSKLKDLFLSKKEIWIIIAIVIISLFPLYYPGFIYTHDGIIHLFRTQGAFENISNFDIFNRIYYNMISGQGYGWGIFYPPLSAIIPGIFMCLGISLFTAEKLFLIFTSVLAGIFAYKLFLELYDNKFCAMIVAILYVLSPYKLNQILIRGAMGEVLAFTFLPLVLLGLIKILKGEGKYKYYFILGMTGIVYSHIISVIYTTIFGALFLLLNYKQLFKKKVIIDLLISSIIIVILSLPIVLPVFEHQNSKDYVISSIQTDVKDRVVHPGQLIASSIEGKEVENTSYYSNEKEMNYMIGLPFIVIVLMFPFFYKEIKNEKGNTKNIVIFSILFIFTIFMMVFPGIWNKVNILDTIQYPWRLLMYSVIFISAISGYIIKPLIKKENQYLLFIVIVSYSLLFSFMIGSNVRFAKTLNSEFNFANQELKPGDDYGTLSFSIGYAHEYLPQKMTTEGIISKGNKVDVISGSAEINNIEKIKNVLIIKGKNNEKNTKLELPLIYYKGYNISVKNADNNMRRLEYEMSEKGYIVIQLDDISEFEISAKYTGTNAYIICDVLAIITLIGYSILIIINKYKEKMVKN